VRSNKKLNVPSAAGEEETVAIYYRHTAQDPSTRSQASLSLYVNILYTSSAGQLRIYLHISFNEA
jgi:hypothetical protein